MKILFLTLISLTACLGCFGQCLFFTPVWLSNTGSGAVSSGGSYTAKAVALSSATLTTSAHLIGASSIASKQGTWSFWYKSSTGSTTFIDQDGGDINMDCSGEISMNYYNVNNQQGLVYTATILGSGMTNIVDGNWHWIGISYDVGASQFQLYIDGTEQNLVSGPSFLNANMYWDDGVWYIGKTAFTGSLADVWIAPTRIDFSVTANLRKFYSSTGHPVDLGSNGSLPTGSAPIIFLTGDATTFVNNNGTGGGFPVTAGTLTTDPSGP